MKELSIEEKAKRYDVAISIMEKYLKSGNAGVIAENTILKAFPELQESEGKKMIQGIIDNLKCLISYIEGEDCSKGAKNTLIKRIEKQIAWVENQGEQILANSAKTCKDEQKPAWGEEDEECLENAIMYCEWARDKAPDLPCYETSEKSITWLKSIKDKVQTQHKQEWREDDRKMLNGIIEAVSHHCYLNQKDIDWLKSIKNKINL